MIKIGKILFEIYEKMLGGPTFLVECIYNATVQRFIPDTFTNCNNKAPYFMFEVAI